MKGNGSLFLCMKDSSSRVLSESGHAQAVQDGLTEGAGPCVWKMKGRKTESEAVIPSK